MTHHSQLGVPGEREVSLSQAEGRSLNPWLALTRLHPAFPQVLQNPQRGR